MQAASYTASHSFLKLDVYYSYFLPDAQAYKLYLCSKQRQLYIADSNQRHNFQVEKHLNLV